MFVLNSVLEFSKASSFSLSIFPWWNEVPLLFLDFLSFNQKNLVEFGQHSRGRSPLS